MASDKEHSYCNLEGWAVLTVPLHANLSVLCFFFLVLSSQRRFDTPFNGLGDKEEPICAGMI